MARAFINDAWKPDMVPTLCAALVCHLGDAPRPWKSRLADWLSFGKSLQLVDHEDYPLTSAIVIPLPAAERSMNAEGINP